MINFPINRDRFPVILLIKRDYRYDDLRQGVGGVALGFTRECLGLVVDTSLTGPRVVRELNCIIESRGCPRMIVSDNGTEFTSNVILAWQEELGIEWHYIAPDKPMQN